MSDLKPCPCGRPDPYVAKWITKSGDLSTHIAQICCTCGWCGPERHGDNAVVDASRVWNRRASDWVSVKERLPTEEDADEFGNVWAWDIYGVGFGEPVHFLEIPVYATLTHWRPLPAPPAGDGAPQGERRYSGQCAHGRAMGQPCADCGRVFMPAGDDPVVFCCNPGCGWSGLTPRRTCSIVDTRRR